MRPVDPGQPASRKRLQTMSASDIFDTDDPLQEPTHNRRRVLKGQMNGLWPMWRDLDQDERRKT
jgi:hypothetical protein